MSILIRFLSLFFLLICSLSAYSQRNSYQYQMDGVFPVIYPGNLAARNIRFVLEWNEEGGAIRGRYRDDFFTERSPVSGTAGLAGKTFKIRLPSNNQGVAQISLTTNESMPAGGIMPSMITLRDRTSAPISQTNISPTVVVQDEVDEGPETCDVGFGVLSGFCGVYTGSIREISDTANRCTLPDNSFAVQLNTDARVNLYFYYSSTVPGIPMHPLGTFSAAPLSYGVSLTNRNCGGLVGTTFNPEGCQVLTLNGSFGDLPNGKSFRGRYTITEEVTGESCSHDVNVERQVQY